MLLSGRTIPVISGLPSDRTRSPHIWTWADRKAPITLYGIIGICAGELKSGRFQGGQGCADFGKTPDKTGIPTGVHLNGLVA